ncbi:hypothetical protein [Neobacillus sp. SuZ13]|uniref:hypothetical protein n=1 Tax=Neobacillus sp. SuZ13 TaxID=3047875 RepID=UPI0024BF47E3|nr:hypothetical protein [Neobacillus sp. SuZ13]WHY65013.1 hypothetical protein QNH17_18050 [Neobacillus sp. SuZ13]
MNEKDSLKIKKLVKENIFCSDFKSLDKNNLIEFDRNHKIAVLYGPNGTGKTSLTKVFSRDDRTEYEVIYNGDKFTHENQNIFHIICDQNGRNIIQGNETDFLVGDNIKKEFELKEKLDNNFSDFFNDLNKILKNDYSLKKVTSNIFGYFEDEVLKSFLKDIVNQKSKGQNLKYEDILKYITENKTNGEKQEFDSEKMDFVINNLDGESSLINTILDLQKKFDSVVPQNILKIEENTTAVEVLNRFNYITDCIVCETHNIDIENLKNKKVQSSKEIFEHMDEESKKLIENVLRKLIDKDPFMVRKILYNILSDVDLQSLDKLTDEIKDYINMYTVEVKNSFIQSALDKELQEIFDEYKNVISEQLELVAEDMLFIQNIISESIDKELKVEKNQDNKITILMENEQLLNKDRSELHLSNGEQNFISLTFELLKAKNTDKEFIMIDDPISSFDSIFKNKIAYALIRFLEYKNQIILSHNVDLIRLLEHQKKDVFNLYLLNNTEGEVNGIIPVGQEEKEILLSIPKLLEVLQTKIFNDVEDEDAFLISLVPFLRGYSQIVLDNESKNKLTQLMHGYNTEKVNITDIYSRLINPTKVFSKTVEISAQDIISFNVTSAKILKDNNNYKMLNRALYHTLNYLYLRLNVEKDLVDLYGINTKKYDMLSSIIFKAFSSKQVTENIKHRAFFASKKTLLNEFNHFDGNLSIFYPALDITDKALEKERVAIISYLEKLKIDALVKS